MKFEYTTLDAEKVAGSLESADRGAALLKALQDLGAQGWELVSAGGPVSYLKRPVANGAPTRLAKVCGNCRAYAEFAQKDAEGQPVGRCGEWKLAVSAEGACERFAEKAYGQPEGQPSPYRVVAGAPTGQTAGPVVAAATGRDSASVVPPDAEGARHWQARTEFGERRVEATTSQEDGVQSPPHKHRVVAIVDRTGQVIRGKAEMANGHEHRVEVLGMCDEADGHTHTFDPTPMG